VSGSGETRHLRAVGAKARPGESDAAAAAPGGGLQPWTARLLIGCADQPGIVAAVSGFLLEQGANIVSSHQFSSDPTGGRFFMRTELFLDDLSAPSGWRKRFEQLFAVEVADRFEMDWEIRWWDERRRIAILVSHHDHCLLDLLWRSRRGELDGEVVSVISNHETLRHAAETTGGDRVAYRHVPVERGRKEAAEETMLGLLQGEADVLVLARYMQILSGEFLERVGMPAINIHHSFLPAFPGADPYRRAHEQGVKLIGATAHYVTAKLDDGPIIDQDVVRVDHRQDAAALERVGRDIERLVLARAVSLHLDDRVIVDGRRTIVF
jgi:formyltetrahydrofolate deformylase